MITVKQMQVLERAAQKQGIFVENLMENAGREVARILRENYGLIDKHVVIFAGTGNNAGDGFVTARYLQEEVPVVVLLFGNRDKLKGEALDNYNRIKDSVIIVPISKQDDLSQFHFQQDHKLILIDALLGTGISGEIRELIALGISHFNSLKGDKISIDAPSGINPDTGEVLGESCNTDLIVALHDLKMGLEEFKDKTVIVDIGIPKNLSTIPA